MLKINNVYLGYFHGFSLVILFLLSIGSVLNLIFIVIPVLNNEENIIKDEFMVTEVDRRRKSDNNGRPAYTTIAWGYLSGEQQEVSTDDSNFFKFAPEETYKDFKKGQVYEVWFFEKNNFMVGRYNENFPTQTYQIKAILYSLTVLAFIIVLILFFPRYKTYKFR